MAAILLLAGSAPRAEEFGPWSKDPRHPVIDGISTAPLPPVPTHSSSPFTLAFRVWSDLLTRIDGPRCSHQPTCSVYAYRAVKRHGILVGVWMALNRLMRGARSSALRTLPMIRTPEGIKYLDPLE